MLIADPSTLGPYFSCRGDNVTWPAGGQQRVARANPNRILLGVSLVTATTLALSPAKFANGQSPALIIGTASTANAGYVILYKDWGPLTGAEWTGETTMAATARIIEVIFTPPASWSEEYAANKFAEWVKTYAK